MIQTEGRRLDLSDRGDIQACRAEIVECGCPDDCERDHGNE
jgi:hypothetical protein